MSADAPATAGRPAVGLDITLSRAVLLRLLERVRHVADLKSSIIVLGAVLLRAKGRALTATTTDLLSGMRASVSAKVVNPGVMLVPVKVLYERVKAMSCESVRIWATDSKMHIVEDGKSQGVCTIATLAVEYAPAALEPAVDSVLGGTTDLVFGIGRKALASLIAQTEYAICKDETRPHRNSMCIEWDGDKVRAIATDGHRLTMAETTGEYTTVMQPALISKRDVTHVKRFCKEAKCEATITLKRSSERLWLQADGMSLSVKLVDAMFPPWRQVVPKKDEGTITIARQPLLDLVKRIAASASKTTHQIIVAVCGTPDGGHIVVSASDPSEQTEASDTLLTHYSGIATRIGLCATYVVDALAACDADQVVFGFGVLTPEMMAKRIDGVLGPVTVRAPGYLAVVMPMRM